MDYMFTNGRLSPTSLPPRQDGEDYDGYLDRLGFEAEPFTELGIMDLSRSLAFGLLLHERNGNGPHEFLGCVRMGTSRHLVVYHGLSDLLDFFQAYSGFLSTSITNTSLTLHDRSNDLLETIGEKIEAAG